jgi:hypothetical protein
MKRQLRLPGPWLGYSWQWQKLNSHLQQLLLQHRQQQNLAALCCICLQPPLTSTGLAAVGKP